MEVKRDVEHKKIEKSRNPSWEIVKYVWMAHIVKKSFAKSVESLRDGWRPWGLRK